MAKYNYKNKERIEELIYKYKQPKTGIVRYLVESNKENIKVKNTFATLEEARAFKQYYIICVAKARLQKKQSMKEFNGIVEERLEYPETLLFQLDITPELYKNYYNEIVCNFETNFEKTIENSNLTDIEIYCLKSYYKDVKTLESIGKILNKSKQNIKQIIARAIRKLKHNGKELLIQGKDKFELISIEQKEEIIKEFKEKISYDLIIEWISNHEITEELLKLCNNILNASGKTIDIKNISIEDLDFSFRTYHFLKKHGIHNVNDLILNTEEDIMKIRNLGRKSLNEVKLKLKEMNLSLKSTEEVR